MPKPQMIGSVWTAKATLYNADREVIAYCVDTPNGIAKAFMELPKAMFVSEMYSKELQPRSKYKERMMGWNKADSNLDVIKTTRSKVEHETRTTTVHDRYRIDCSECGFIASEMSFEKAIKSAQYYAKKHNEPNEKVSIFDVMARRGVCDTWDVDLKCTHKKE